MKKKKSKKPKKRVAVVTKKVTKLNGIKVITIIILIISSIGGVGGKMLYDRIQELTNETKEMRKEIMVISNFAAESRLKFEMREEKSKENKERIDELYRILNR